MPESRAVLRDATLLRRYIERTDTTQADVARAAGCSRQFVHQLLTGGVTGCTPPVAKAIEEHLGLIQGTLFLPAGSSNGRHRVTPRQKAGSVR